MTKKSKSMGLSLAVVAAAAMMMGAVSTSVAQTSYNVSPASLLQQVMVSVKAGRIDTALAIIARLREMGVTQITVGGEMVQLASLEKLVRDGSPQAIDQLVAYATIATSVSASFQVQNVVSASALKTNTVSNDSAFPTGSVG